MNFLIQKKNISPIGEVAQLVGPALQTLSMVAYTCNPSTLKARGSEVQNHHQIHSKFKVSPVIHEIL